MPDDSMQVGDDKDAWKIHNPKLSHGGGMSRRSVLKVGASALGLLASSSVGFAATCPSTITPRQTRGPYFPYDDVVSYSIREKQDSALSLIESSDDDLTYIKGKKGRALGTIIHFRGQVMAKDKANADVSGSCSPLSGAVVLLWQANSFGRYNHQSDETAQRNFPHPKTRKVITRLHDEQFQYWGKAVTDKEGKFYFKTILPGFYPAADDWYRPPHLHFSIRAKGHQEFVTQTYFSGTELPESGLIRELNAKDWILRDSRIQPEQQEQVIVDYQSEKNSDGFVGSCQFFLPS